MKKMKILTLSDMPFMPSGVAGQTKYMIEGLLRTGKYQFVSLGGAIRHEDYQPIKTEEFGEDWIIHPVDNYGNEGIVRSIMRGTKADAMWIMTDPRFWEWLWSMENEIRPNMPLIYYHVWDNYPYPKYNIPYYESNDVIASISKLTYDVTKTLAPDVQTLRIPHTVDTDIFKKRKKSEWVEAAQGQPFEGRFVFFWNNRNARRKQSGTLLWWYNEFLDKVGRDRACLIMHTEPEDPHGQDLKAIMRELNLTPSEALLSVEKMSQEELSKMYNLADCVINISDAEGFGLSTLESLACETPIIVNMTGGLQEQVTDGKNWFGIGIEPASKAIIGSQRVPYIYEDRINKEDFIRAMTQMIDMPKHKRESLGRHGRKYVLKNYSMENYIKLWDDLFTRVHSELGSWSNRKGFQNWRMEEI